MEQSNDYPLGGMIEHHDIESEKEMTEKFGEPIPVPGHTDDSKPIGANEMCHDCDFICEFHNRHCDHITLTEENSELVRNLAAALNMPDDEDQEEDQMVYTDEISEDVRDLVNVWGDPNNDLQKQRIREQWPALHEAITNITDKCVFL